VARGGISAILSGAAAEGAVASIAVAQAAFAGFGVLLVWAGSIILLPVFFAPWPQADRQLTRGGLAATFG
jgi:hypothetical protein